MNESARRLSGLRQQVRTLRTQDDSCCLHQLIPKPTASYPVSSLAFTPHQIGEQMKMATLVQPMVFLRKKLRPPKSIGNKGANAIFHHRKDKGNRSDPSLVTFTSFKEHWIKKIRFVAASRLYCNEIHNPLSALELEIQSVANERIWAARQRFDRIRLRRHGAHGVRVSLRNGISGKAENSLLVGNGVPFQENTVEQRNSNAFAFSPSSLLPNAPCAFADTTLPSTLAETIYSPSATRRFRVLCGHTRELWHKNADLI